MNSDNPNPNPDPNPEPEHVICPHCGTDLGPDTDDNCNYTTTADGDRVCEDCLHDQYFYCRDCGEWGSLRDNHYVMRGGDVLCERCFDSGDYYTCDDCGAVFEAGDVEVIGDHTYCHDCAEEHGVVCPECDERHSDDDGSRYDEFCEACVSKARPTVYDYHSWDGNIEPRFLPEERRSVPSTLACLCGDDTKTPLFGVELEFGQADTDRLVTIPEIRGDCGELFHFEFDGSLDTVLGAELITQPCSLRYHQTQFGWDKVCKALVDAGFVSHNCGCDTCGLHVHISRGAMSDLTIMKLDAFVNRNAAFWGVVARRLSRSWASVNPQKTIRDSIESAKRTRSLSRYQAVNHTNPCTVEIRMARGSLRAATVLGTIELYAALVAYAKCASIVDATDVTGLGWAKFVNFVKAHRAEYPAAVAYLGQDSIARHLRAVMHEKRREFGTADELARLSIRDDDSTVI